MLNLQGMDGRLMPQPIFEDETKGHSLSSHGQPFYLKNLKYPVVGSIGSYTNIFFFNLI
jgi:hypothetical protein